MIKLILIIYMVIGIIIAKMSVDNKITDNNTEKEDAMICIYMLCITIFWPFYLIGKILYKLIKN